MIGTILVSIVAIGLFGAVRYYGDDVSSFDQVGATVTGDGKVVIRYELCAGETVDRVALRRTDDDHTKVTETLWVIEAEGIGSEQETFIVGVTPPAFREVVAFNRQLEDNDYIDAAVTSSKYGEVSVPFQVGELRTGRVLVNTSGYLSPNEFGDRANEACV